MLQTVTILFTICGMLACPLRCWAHPEADNVEAQSNGVFTACHCASCEHDETGHDEIPKEDCTCNCLCQGAIPTDEPCVAGGSVEASFLTHCLDAILEESLAVHIDVTRKVKTLHDPCRSAQEFCALLQSFSL